MDKCKKCHKEVKFILNHLKRSLECQTAYDMIALSKRAKDAAKERKQQKYQSDIIQRKQIRKVIYKNDPEKIKRRERVKYKNNPESKKQTMKEYRKEHYKKNQEKEKEYRKDHYKKNQEKEKQYNKEYHRLNRDTILPKMRKYNKSYKPMRSAINKFKKAVTKRYNSMYGDNDWYIGRDLYHMYYHTLGLCDEKTVLNVKHSVQEYPEKCESFDSELYRLAGYNTIYCVNVKCGQTTCHICSKNVSPDPQKLFKHFYIHSGIMPGLCPLFEDFDKLRTHQCSDISPCYSTKPTVIPLNDYGNHLTMLPTVPCSKCEDVMSENPSLLDKCLKIQKFGFGPKPGKKYCLEVGPEVSTGKKFCRRIGSEINQIKSVQYYTDKEFHFLNCYICGWKDSENHFRKVHFWKEGHKSYYKVPMSVEQKIFYVDQPDYPGSSSFGNSTYDRRLYNGKYMNFEFLCNLNEHIVDHSPEGKSCLMIEARLNAKMENIKAKDHITLELNKLDNIHTILGVEDTFESCENFRVQHIVEHDFQKKKVKNIACHINYIESNSKSVPKPCDIWKLGKCSDTDVINIYLILKRNTTPNSIFEILDKLEYVSEWMLSYQEPFSDVIRSPGRQRCHCKSLDGGGLLTIKNPFCPVLVTAYAEEKIEKFEHIGNCLMEGDKKDMKPDDTRFDMIGINIFNHFLPQFKLLLKYCKCQGNFCLGKVKGWNCQDCNSNYCKTGHFFDVGGGFYSEGPEMDVGYPYCISNEQGKTILSIGEDYDSTDSDSDSESESEEEEEEEEEDDSEDYREAKTSEDETNSDSL